MREGDCIHFTGMQHKTCAVGVSYDDVKAKDRRPVRLACLNASYPSSATCHRFTPRTAEQAAKERAETDAAIAAALAGKCPQCGATCTRHESESAAVIACPTHGFVMRECRRIGEP